ncbi:Golgi resident protein GCP60 [Folsomia candida]|uniref:Golgi resident protein GCP60 n=1 Tax=Folsomia candida TaxID=158441 RepID=UPI000B90A214|nr:Golgi resident protein GCP60 [Folsomia candida]
MSAKIESSTFQNSSSRKSVEVDSTPFLSDWGFTLKDLYNLGLHFYRDKQGKAVHFSYEERLKLSALNCQISHGKFNSETAPPVGVLDVIGKDRRLAWQGLGEKSKSDCMFEFITLVHNQSPLFKPFVEANKRDLEEKSRVRKEVEEAKSHMDEEYLIARELERQAEENRHKMEEQKRRIQDALNQQTFQQFMSYAEQQYPGNPDQQGVLIRQLQEQHYEQYMRQLYQQQSYAAQKAEADEKEIDQSGGDHSQNNNPRINTQVDTEAQLLSEGLKAVQMTDNNETEMNGRKSASDSEKEDGNETDAEEEDGNHTGSSLAAASMWTRKDIKDFKESVTAEGGEAIIRIGQGESVTVRVPTHPEGSCLFWEFATDNYDVGFGLFFEWTNTEESVSVHVSDTTSEDEDEDDEAFQALQDDLEKGRELLPKGSKPNTDVIIPVFRRDAHQEVYVGSHLFPGKGVYLLKFDNSYSFWRSKTLYYRVYYTK